MRILLTIPHVYKPADNGLYGSTSATPEARMEALCQAMLSLHQAFGKRHCIFDQDAHQVLPLAQVNHAIVDIVVCTTPSHHLLADLPVAQGLYQHVVCHPPDPMWLGFECHAVLRDRLGHYDFYGYMEDDVVINDPFFFTKLRQFTGQFGNKALLQPHRYEISYRTPVQKAYLDGNLPKSVTASYQNIDDIPVLEGTLLGMPVRFCRTSNPHAACFFLNAEQMAEWIDQSHFLERDAGFMGPLESAASLGIMRTFRVYKPHWEHAHMVEVRHFDARYIEGTFGMASPNTPSGANIAG